MAPLNTAGGRGFVVVSLNVVEKTEEAGGDSGKAE